jgi:lysophospholipase L1-like esterase
MLLLCHGGNDFLRKMDDAAAAQNVRAMVRLARERNIPVVLVATPKPDASPVGAAVLSRDRGRNRVSSLSRES